MTHTRKLAVGAGVLLAAAGLVVFLTADDSGQAVPRAATRPSKPRFDESVRPSDRLTVADRVGLARVEDKQFIHTSEHFTVVSRNARLSRLLANHAERTLKGIARSVMGPAAYPHRVRVVVYATSEEAVSHAWQGLWENGGFFSITVGDDGVTHRTIHLAQNTNTGTFDTQLLDEVLPHELCHMVLSEWFGDTPCPPFLQEGLSMLAEFGTQESRVLQAGAAAAAGASNLDCLMSLSIRSPQASDLWYAQSYSLVSYLHRQLGERGFNGFLGEIKSGASVADAVRRAWPDADKAPTLAELEASWREDAVTQAMVVTTLKKSDPSQLAAGR